MEADSGLIIDDLEQDENNENVDPDEDEEAAEQVQFEKGTTTRGALALWFRGHRYVRIRTNCAWFRCEKRFCPASAKLVDEETMHGILGAKEHKCGVARPEKRKAEEGRVNLLKKMTEETMLKKGRAITHERQKLDDAAAMRMGRNEALNQMMRRKENKMFGQLNVASPLDMAIPDDLVQKGEDRILIYDNREDGNRPGEGDVVLVFSHPKQLELLRTCSRWAFDGTHSVTPTGWAQTFVIGCFIRRKLVVCCYALLPGHAKKHYKEALGAVVNKIGQPIHHREVIIDMELAIKRAVEEVLPNSQLSACFFHYTQALARKWRSMAVERRCDDNNELTTANSTLRDLMALALIPVEFVRKAFYQCLSVAPQGLEDFLRYFARTYMGLSEFERELGEAAFERGAEFEFRRRQPIADRWDLPIVVSPRYEPNFWNVHDRARLIIEKTNNPLEIQHKHFSKNLNHHPSMVHFLQALSDDTDVQLDRGRYWAQHPEEAAKPSRKKYVLKEGDLLVLLDAVDYLAPGEPHVTVRSLAHQMITYTEAIPVNVVAEDVGSEEDIDVEE